MTISVPIETSASTAAQARAENAAKIGKFRAALVSAGINAGSIKSVAPRGPFGFVGNERYGDETGLPQVSFREATPANARSQFDLELTNQTQVDAATHILDELDLKAMGGPVPSLKDNKGQLRLAIANAVSEAKWQATAYADALNMRIVGVKRVEMSCENVNSSLAGAEQMMKLFQGVKAESRWNVDTAATVCVTYLAN